MVSTFSRASLAGETLQFTKTGENHESFLTMNFFVIYVNLQHGDCPLEYLDLFVFFPEAHVGM